MGRGSGGFSMPSPYVSPLEEMVGKRVTRVVDHFGDGIEIFFDDETSLEIRPDTYGDYGYGGEVFDVPAINARLKDPPPPPEPKVEVKKLPEPAPDPLTLFQKIKAQIHEDEENGKFVLGPDF
jgi:hypothetical protein